MEKPCVVSLSKQSMKQLKKLPIYVKEAALVWVKPVEEQGIRKIRRLLATMTSHYKASDKDKGQ